MPLSGPTGSAAPRRAEGPPRLRAPDSTRQGERPRPAPAPGAGGIGQALGQLWAGTRRAAAGLAVFAVAAGATLGLSGCGSPVPPSPGVDVEISIRDGIQVTGETPDHAELRIKAHTLANEGYMGSKWAMFAHHALADGDLELTAPELAALMTKAGADPSEVQGVRGVETLGDLVRFLEGGQTPAERRDAWAAHLVSQRDADGSGGLSYREFSPLLEVPQGPVR